MHDETVTKDAYKVAHFCSMKMAQDVRDYAARPGITEEDTLQKGLEEKSIEFKRTGAQIYQKV